MQWSPTFLAPEMDFIEDNFSRDQGRGMVSTVLKHRDIRSFMGFLRQDYGAGIKVFSKLQKKGSTEMINILSELH